MLPTYHATTTTATTCQAGPSLELGLSGLYWCMSHGSRATRQLQR